MLCSKGQDDRLYKLSTCPVIKLHIYCYNSCKVYNDEIYD